MRVALALQTCRCPLELGACLLLFHLLYYNTRNMSVALYELRMSVSHKQHCNSLKLQGLSVV